MLLITKSSASQEAWRLIKSDVFVEVRHAGVYGAHRLYFSTSRSFNNKWRLKQGLEPNPNRYGPIKVLPDYSFADGRPVPLSYVKIKQMEYQQKLCQRIVELNHELDAGLQQYYENQEQQEQAKIAIIQNKLKPKGAALLKKNNSSNNSIKEKTGNSLMDRMNYI